MYLRVIGLLCCAFLATSLFAEEPRVRAVSVTAINSFTSGIEGPSCDRDGNLFAVNFERRGTVGRVDRDGNAEVYLTLPENGVGNATRFDRHGSMFIADHVNHRILKVAPGSRECTIYAEEPSMFQPNDLTITADGTIFASDPDWKQGGGRIWRIDHIGRCEIVVNDLKLPNGVETSPDGQKLYVALTEAAEIIVFDIKEAKQLSNQKSLIRFETHLVDGIRCDVEGNLFVARYGSGTIAVVSPDGKLLHEIEVLGAEPSNLCFGGKDGRTVFVTEVQNRRVVKFDAAYPGADWSSNQ